MLPPFPTYHCRKIEAPIRLDGVLNEAAWADAEVAPLALNADGNAADPAPGAVRFCRDDEALYIGLVSHDRNVRASGAGRDGIEDAPPNDLFRVLIDAAGDSEHFFELTVNPLGAAGDALVIAPAPGSPLFRGIDSGVLVAQGIDLRGWAAAARVVGTPNHPEIRDEGWSAEIVLPYRTILQPFDGPGPERREPPFPGDAWRCQVLLQNCDLPARVFRWSPTMSPSRYRGVERFGRLAFGEPAPPNSP
jgi:hypothetical protein